MIHPILAQALGPWVPPAKPRFEKTYCSQCGRDTGPGDAGHSSCATHGPAASGFDLSGLIDYWYTTDTGFTLRCYLEHDEAVAGGGDAHPNASEKVWLVYAFAGATDVFELVEQVPGLQAKIEAEALADLQRKAKESHAESAISRWEDRMAA